MMRLVWILLLLASPALAQTGTATLLCTPPTQNTDGTPVKTPLTFRFFMGTVSGTYTATSPTQTSCAYTWPSLAAGTYYFVATAIDGNGTESAKSNQASKTLVGASPNPPTNLTATGSLMAYQLVLSNGRVGFLSVGTLAPGTACDVTQPVGNKYVVNRNNVVSWIGNAQPQLVVADCS